MTTAQRNDSDPTELIRQKALWMRRTALKMVYKKNLGHIGGDFSATDVLSTLYFGVLNYDPDRPEWDARDRFVMSKGHATGVLYSALCAAGYFPQDWLETYMGPRSMLNGHPNRNYLPGVETNTGPLGHGFPVALGIAIAGQITGASYRTYVLTGDGEQQEGSNWEAAMVAGNRKLANLTLIVDRNRLQQGAGTEETNGLDPLDDKYRAFGWEVVEVDGHDHAALLDVLGAPVGARDKPLCVIANTVKGKGVSFMEGLAKWHHGVPNAEEYEQAMKELV
ncbi:transketolase [Chachezhania antarctica]|uniref:transketolase n=1 Tax=Chachezhania antarctica TaxID=2340860 RepID=UPI000EB32015|nr:transketolase [Chachezhania antarctica]|tara:strand:- start:22556 stop:23392 length:837 start_codon:yes stop_codon:yes gene_type:complete